MKQLLILSGKGGTGKTTVASAFIKLSQAKAFADCDVDAPNLHLVLEQSAPAQTNDYYGLPKAHIDPDLCVACGLCMTHCRFEAISGPPYHVDPIACEGCAVCQAICPADAVSMTPDVAGTLTLYKNKTHVFSTAQLNMGSGTSGKLVTGVKKQMKTAATADTEIAIIDGSPGIGCPVIASMNGAHLVLIVAEPSVSGISDMKRIIKTAETFRLKLAVCINKFDTNSENTEKIEAFCRASGITFVGRIPFDPQAVKIINSGRTIADTDCPSGRAVKDVFTNTMRLLADDDTVRPTLSADINNDNKMEEVL